jgi:hypothetical protein
MDFTPIISTFAQMILQSVSNSGCSDDKMHTWLLGDFNLPKYDWVKQEFKPNCKFINTYNNFFDIMNDHNLEQVVHI